VLVIILVEKLLINPPFQTARRIQEKNCQPKENVY
jgi:hypothetical protein